MSSSSKPFGCLSPHRKDRVTDCLTTLSASPHRKGRRLLQVFTDDDNDISSLLSAKSPTSSDTKSDLGFATSSDTGSEPSDQQVGHSAVTELRSAGH